MFTNKLNLKYYNYYNLIGYKMFRKSLPAIQTTALLAVALLFIPVQSRQAWAFDWTPSDEEIAKYRKSWNPFSEGPLLIQSVDIHPQGQLSVRPFLFSQVSERATAINSRPRTTLATVPFISTPLRLL